MGRQDELVMHSDGGCRIVTTARAVCNVLERAIRTRQLVFLFAASLGNMCRQYSPMLLQTFPTQDLTQFIAGATLHQRLVGNKKFHQRKWRRTPVRHLQEQMRPAEAREKDDQTRMPPETLEEKIPLADAGREIVTWRPLPGEERDAWENLSPRNKETCDALLHRLHRVLGHSDIRGVVDSFRQPIVYPTILAAAKLMKCGACQARASFSLRPVVSGRLAEPGAVPQEDKVCWKHPAREIHRKGTLSVDIASRVTVVRIWKSSLRA